jgi:ABC-type transport system involved in multi-copper enzyme maturation permease subunit
VAARQTATYGARVGLAAGAILVLTYILLATLGQPPNQIGQHIFQGLSGLMFLFCLVYGRSSTADCLSQEKREGTLGLLFLTDLKGLDVILAKLAATSLRGFYGLLGMFPVLAVPLLLGGISSGELWRVLLVLMNTFLFSLAIGMLGSAVSRDRNRALSVNLLLLLLLVAVPPACMFALGYFFPGSPRISGLLFSCPAYAFYLCNDLHYVTGQFWWSMAVIHGLTWLLLMAACWIVPHSWQDQPAQAVRSRPGALWHAWRYGPARGQAAFRKRMLDVGAFYWLAGRARFKPIQVWTFLAFVIAWWVTGWLTTGDVWLDSSVSIFTALMLNFALKVWVAIEAGQQLAEDRRTGAFELLLSVPLTVDDILRGQLLALRRQFLWPVLAVLGAWLWFVATMHPRQGAPWPLQAMCLAGMLMLGVDLVALTWVGMWRALVARSHNRATLGTLGRVLVLPWVLVGTAMAGGHVWFWLARGEVWSPGWQVFLAMWVGFGLAVDLGFGLTAAHQLSHHFRELALGPHSQTMSQSASRLRPEPRAQPIPPGTPANPAQQQGDKDIAEPAFPSVQRRLRPRARLVWLIAGLALLLPIGLYFSVLRPKAALPPPVVAMLSSSNGPVRVFGSGGGALLILPDGSLWQWGRPWQGLARGPRFAVPEQLGTNLDWVEAAAGFNYRVALRRDGSLWEWGHPGGNASASIDSEAEPRRLNTPDTWTGVAATATYCVALRGDGTLWSCGYDWTSVSGPGARPGTNALVQVGTNSDWAAVCCPPSSTLALRRDGTLWAWGRVLHLGSGLLSSSILAQPTRVCLDSNWNGFVGCGIPTLVRNDAGELWEPFQGAPNPQCSAALNCRRVVSHALPGRFATAWRGESKAYEVRSDGTLWERTQPLYADGNTPAGEWRRLGKRSDWTGVWGAGGTAIGLTAEGTLWTWGLDLSQQPTPDFMSRLRRLQDRLITLIGSGPKPSPAQFKPVYQSQPRPLMRLINTNAVPPAPRASLAATQPGC